MLSGNDFIILPDDEAKLLRDAARKYLASLKRKSHSLEDHLTSNLCSKIESHLEKELV